MIERRMLQVDVFTNRPGFGNALAVVLDGEGIDDVSMQRFAAWTNLSETTFLLPPTDERADYRVRIFTPRQELPFAGHPSVGSAYAALHAGLITPKNGKLVQQCTAGLLPMRVEGDTANWKVHVRAPEARQRRANDDEMRLLSPIFPALDQSTFDRAVVVDNGPSFWIVALPDEVSVRTLAPNLAAMSRLCAASACVGVAVYASTDPGSAEQISVRVFCPNDGIAEDPVTGSANAAIASVLHGNGELSRVGNPYRVSQGREMGRNGIVEVSVEDDGAVWVGGESVVVIEGVMRWSNSAASAVS
ncbi:MAG: PhzF family phenazine biosynthesis protein [Dokdonella sp.]